MKKAIKKGLRVDLIAECRMLNEEFKNTESHNPQSEIRNLNSLLKAGVGERSLDIFHFKGDSMEFW